MDIHQVESEIVRSVQLGFKDHAKRARNAESITWRSANSMLREVALNMMIAFLCIE